MGNRTKKFHRRLERAWLQPLSSSPPSPGARSIPHSTFDLSGAVAMSCNPMTQSSENQFFHWCQDLERKQEEQARKMKELQSHVEGSQRNNDQSRTQIGESREPGEGIINKAFFKAFFINLCKSPLIGFGSQIFILIIGIIYVFLY